MSTQRCLWIIEKTNDANDNSAINFFANFMTVVLQKPARIKTVQISLILFILLVETLSSSDDGN